jgi:hypothetical protein
VKATAPIFVGPDVQEKKICDAADNLYTTVVLAEAAFMAAQNLSSGECGAMSAFIYETQMKIEAARTLVYSFLSAVNCEGEAT